MLFKNALIENAEVTSDFRITDGKFDLIASDIEPLPGEEVIDLGKKLVLPPFIESHVHLDTCLTAGDPVWNQSGTLLKVLSAGVSVRTSSAKGIYVTA